MTPNDARRGFAAEVAAALALLQGDRPSPATVNDLPDLPLGSLLRQCEDMVRASGAQLAPPLRCVHHMACTGGTLISRCLGAMPNVQLLSEVDPLSPFRPTSDFTPTDLINLTRRATRPVDDPLLINLFLSGLAVLLDEMRRIGCNLVLRDHPHGKYCFGPQISARPALRKILAGHFEQRAVVTVRHPLDSFLALEADGWQHFAPFTLEEYAGRYKAFLLDHAGLPILRYEDFVEDPAMRMQWLCAELDIGYNPGFIDIFPVLHLSGDSGRTGSRIAHRSRRPLPPLVAAEDLERPAYQRLCHELGYDTKA